MTNSVRRPVVAAAIALLPVSILTVVLNDGPFWVALASWAVVAAVLIPTGLAIDRARSRGGSR
ncbi:hypothetical protein [Micromonospora endolithica]|uniref:Uncharacterized protein n=1 Tax=Micromonospora endolithica TaxID=230091 RepID=A0A3A9ZDF5_9ACTN|nr:hypothetical protein [Micromonospora endolithica]RKN45347.1 hypothetical protein D7223_17165 [Micromonospora endolithica]TWJ22954.1 hypothetical protein JD76_03078 [Micromonospora endolithica]